MTQTEPAKTKLFIDMMALGSDRISGIGHAVHELVTMMLNDPAFMARHEVVMVIAGRKLPLLKAWGFQNVTYRSIFMPTRIFDKLPALPFIPPVDIFMGKGIYLFPNYKAWPLLHSKSLTFIYDISYVRFPESFSRRFTYMLQKGVPRWIKRSTHVATDSVHARQEIMDEFGVPEERISVVPLGVHMSHFYRRNESEVAQLRERYGLPENYILFVGNIEPRKNLARLIRAYLLLPEELKRLHPLVLVGGASWVSDEITAEIEHARASHHAIIRPDKYVSDEDLPALYSGAAVLAHPALYEGFGLSPLQAMACELPVVLANNSAMPEVAGDAAEYVTATDEADIAAKLEVALTNQTRRHELIAKGLERARMFSWEKSWQAYSKLIQDLEAAHE